MGVMAALLAGCAREWRTSYDGQWSSPLYSDHALVGRLWSPAEGRFATVSEVVSGLRGADFVLVGEKHNNADHHRYQSDLIAEMFALDRQPAIVFEMLTPDQQATLDSHLADHPGDSAGIGKAVGWEARGWPSWSTYRPITDIALAHGAPLRAGGLDSKALRDVSSQGADALGADRVHRLRLDEPIGEAMRAGMRREIHEGHCGQLPERLLDPMVTVTLAKDAAMAEAMIDGRALKGRDSALLIAGGGHVRNDWGVPWHLSKLAPGARIVSFGLIEVMADEFDPNAYAAIFEGALPFDFVWFAPRVDDDDPCAVFAEQLRRLRKKHGEDANAADN